MPRYSQQSPYPTGRAPLAFDLSEQMWNIAQQRIQNRKQEIEEQQKQISENEAILLTALDFETVKGAQDKFTLDMAGRMKTLTDKWALRMKDRTGILTTEDKLELLRDKRDIESRMQVGAANVAQYENLVKQVYADKEGKIFDKKKSLENLGKFALSGDIGYKSPMDAVIMQPQPVGQDFMADVEGLAKEMKIYTTLSQEPTGIRDDGQTKWKFTNKPLVENLMARAQNLPSFQRIAQENYGQAMELLNSIPKFYTIERFDYEKDGTAGASGGKSVAQIRADKEEQDKFSAFNNLALNLIDRNAEEVERIKSTNFGNIERINYTQEPDGTYMHVHFKKTSADDQRDPEKIKLPENENDTEGVKTFYQKLWDVLPSKYIGEIKYADIPKTIKPRSGKFTGKQEPFYAEKSVEKTLDKAIKTPNRTFFQEAADTIKKYVPGFKIKATSYGFDVDGKTYNIKNPQKGTANTPEALKAKVMENIKPQKQLDPNAPEAESSAPATQNKTAEYEEAKKYLIQRRNLVGYKQLFNEQKEDFPDKSDEEIKAKLAEFGITE